MAMEDPQEVGLQARARPMEPMGGPLREPVRGIRRRSARFEVRGDFQAARAVVRGMEVHAREEEHLRPGKLPARAHEGQERHLLDW